MIGLRRAKHTMREPGWPDHGSQSLTLTLALRLVRRYERRVPTIAQLTADFDIHRATAYRWRAAFADSLAQEAAHAIRQ